MTPRTVAVTLTFVFAAALPLRGDDKAVAGLKVPPGFVVREYADQSLANDVTHLSIDAAGRVLVGGPGYVRVLADDNGDGRADRAVDLIDGLRGVPMGMLAEGDSLYVVAEGGLTKYRGYDGKTKLSAKPEAVLAVKAGGEHDAHAVRRGPDGWLYLLCGNMAGVKAATATGPHSPVKEPVAGVLLRISPDGKAVEVVADGFRNPYDFDFDAGGEPYTYDSDNERCVGLPWYEPTRFYKVRPGGNHGWLAPQQAQTWRKPPYFLDVEAPVTTLGRGSPTGCVCYRGTLFPPAYRGEFFLADWTFGRVYAVNRAGGPPAVFLEAGGDNGFAPTAMAVHPATGELFVSIGGRGTRGGVYRVGYAPPAGTVAPEQPAAPPAAVRRPPGLDAVRLLQLAVGGLTAKESMGTVWEGYTFRRPNAAAWAAPFAGVLRSAFPSGDPRLDRELTRTLAAIGDPDPRSVAKLATALTEASDPLDDIHLLIVLSRLPGSRTPADTTRVAEALLALDQKIERAKLTRDQYWPLRVGQAAAALARFDPTLGPAIVASPKFGRPDHALYAKLPGVHAATAARRFVAAAKDDPEYGWTPGLVALVGRLPDAEARPVLAALQKRGGLDDALVPLLAREPDVADRAWFVAALKSADAKVVRAAAEALRSLPASPDGSDMVGLIRALRRVPDAPPEADARRHLGDVLAARTGQKHGPDANAWADWFTRTYPDRAKALNGTDGIDVAAWKSRLASVDWSVGDAAGGQKVFTRATCAACHNGARAIGPSLQGVSKRFNRDDLLTALVDPGRDVSPRYRPLRLGTVDGKSYTGMIVYEAVDGVILQTGPDATVRVAGSAIESRRVLDASLMPAGLLDKLTDRDIADLLAYLRTLGDTPPK